MNGRIVLVLAALLMPPGASFADAPSTAPYLWNRVAVGGGGYVTGLVAHPLEPNLIYMRTDNGGAYRFDAAKQEWIWITSQWKDSEKNYYGIDGIAIDPNNADVVYIAAGKSATDVGGIFKSADRGNTWVKVKTLSFSGNGDLRWTGELIAVDPNNSSILYSGSRNNGLFRSTDDGTTWNPVAAVPAGTSGLGIRTVAIDPGSAAGGVSQRIFVGVVGAGVYMSSDGGATWSAMTGSPIQPHRMAVASDGTLYVTAKSGVFRFNNSIWAAISPANYAFAGLDVARDNPNRIIVAADYHSTTGLSSTLVPIYLSNNAGGSWTSITPKSKWTVEAPWYQKLKRFSAATSDLQFDPFNASRVWISDWYQTMVTDNADAATVQWSQKIKGHEQLSALGLAAPSAGASLLIGTADNRAFRHTSLTNYPSAWQNVSLEVTGIDFTESVPNNMFQVGGNSSGGAAYSTNNGASWTKTAWPYGGNGKLAVSATDPNLAVVVPRNSAPKRTINRGAAWQDTMGAPPGGVFDFYSTQEPIASDRVDGAVFYYADPDGGFYRSSDGGATWTKTSTVPVQTGYTVRAAPGMAGEVWVNAVKNGLYRSNSGGASFSKLNNVDSVVVFAFGKNPPSRTNPAVFLHGMVSGVEGIFRSDDLGDTWIKINDSSSIIGVGRKTMQGDRQVFGRVYIGTGGGGVFYGEPDTSDTTPPSVPANLEGIAVSAAQIDLTWNASTDLVGVAGYKVFRDGTQIGTTNGTTTSFADNTVSANTTYPYTVLAFDAAGNNSGLAGPVSVTTPASDDSQAPTPPTNFSGSAASSTLVNLSWTASADNVAVTGYKVFRGGTQIGTATGTSYADNTVSANTTYSYTVSAFDAAGNNSGLAGPVSVTTPPVSTTVTWEARVSASGNDAEEFIGGTTTDLSSTDLELVTDGTTPQLVGMRFINLTIPKDATITNAYIQFTTDEVSTVSTTLTIAAEAVDNSAIFTTADNNITARALEGVTASWSPAAWNTIDEAGANQRTTNLASVVQQIVNRPGWASGNALSFIVSGSGKRVASSFNIFSGTKAPLLHVEWTTGIP